MKIRERIVQMIRDAGATEVHMRISCPPFLYPCYFGTDISERFCKRNNFDAIIRSHGRYHFLLILILKYQKTALISFKLELRNEGFSQDHPYCYTIFSSSSYCRGRNRAAVIIIQTENKGITHHTFHTDSFRDQRDLENRREFIATLIKYMQSEVDELLPMMRAVDLRSSGVLQLSSWSRVLSDFILTKHDETVDPEHFVTLASYLVPLKKNEDGKLIALYEEMFFNLTNSMKENDENRKREMHNDYLDFDTQHDEHMEHHVIAQIEDALPIFLTVNPDPKWTVNVLDDHGGKYGDIPLDDFNNVKAMSALSIH